jgi:RNA polymerase sigma factor (sigma-70 family)
MVTKEQALEVVFETAVTELRPLLIRRAAGIVRHCAEAEDIVQQALGECYANLASFDEGAAKLGTWITETVQRRALDAVRNCSTKLRLEADEGFPDLIELKPDEAYNKEHKLPPGTLIRRAQRKAALGSSGSARYRDGDEDTNEPSYSVDYDAVIDLKAGLLALPKFRREVVLAVFVEGYTFEEYAEKVGKSKTWIQRTAEKGLRALRKRLGEEKKRRPVYA